MSVQYLMLLSDGSLLLCCKLTSEVIPMAILVERSYEVEKEFLVLHIYHKIKHRTEVHSIVVSHQNDASLTPNR